MLTKKQRNTLRGAVFGLTLAGMVGTGILSVSAAEAASPVVKFERDVVTCEVVSGNSVPSVGTGLIDGLKDDLRPVEEVELDLFFEDLSMLSPEVLVDIDLTEKLLGLSDRLNDIFDLIGDVTASGTHGVGGIDAAEELGWAYDLSKTLDSWFRDDDGDCTPNWRDGDLDGDGISNKDDDDIDDDGVPNTDDDYPRDRTRSIMAGSEAGPMGRFPAPPMVSTGLESARSSVIDIVIVQTMRPTKFGVGREVQIH